MADSFFESAGPFTMVSHLLAQEVGLTCSAVYGAVWKRCQMEGGVCDASLDTLGLDITVDRATVMRSIKKLCGLDYLTDQTPNRRNAPHTYTLSKSVAQCNSSAHNDGSIHEQTVAGCNKSVAERNTENETVAECNKSVAESQLNKKREINTKDKKNNLDSSSSSSCADVWPQVEAILEMRMTRASYAAVMRGTSLIQENGHYVVTAPTEAAKELLENRFADQVTFAVSSVTGAPAEIKFRLSAPGNPPWGQERTSP